MKATPHSGRIERSKGLKVLARLHAGWQKAFDKACEHDGIKRGMRFSVFSEGNPYRQFVDKAAQEYFQAVREYQAGGYIGISMRWKGGQP